MWCYKHSLQVECNSHKRPVSGSLLCVRGFFFHRFFFSLLMLSYDADRMTVLQQKHFISCLIVAVAQRTLLLFWCETFQVEFLRKNIPVFMVFHWCYVETCVIVISLQTVHLFDVKIWRDILLCFVENV